MTIDDMIAQAYHDALERDFDRKVEIFISRAEARDCALLAGDQDPRTYDSAAAAAAGHPDLIICPTLLTSTAGKLAAEAICKIIGLKALSVQAFEPSLLYFEHVYAESTLTFSLHFQDCYIGPGGSSGFFIVSSTVGANDVDAVAEVCAILKTP